MLIDVAVEQARDTWIITEEGVESRRLFGLYQMFQLFLTIGTGLMEAFQRFINFVVLMVLSLTRLDRSVYPNWVQKFLADSGYTIYLTTLKMHHYHNNPTTTAFT